MNWGKIIAIFIGVSMLFTIVFVRAGTTGKSGGEQASAIIDAGATGFSKIIKSIYGLS